MIASQVKPPKNWIGKFKYNKERDLIAKPDNNLVFEINGLLPGTIATEQVLEDHMNLQPLRLI